ncbi:hypothetical protein Tco_0448408 [Tanacetum coccineum]
MKVKESLNVTFDETPPPPKTSPLEDDDLVEEEAIKASEIKPLGNDVEDKSLENNEIINIKESQSHPLENVIEDSKPMQTPMSTETKLTKDEEGESMDDTTYREDPKTSHLQAVKRIFRYIKAAPSLNQMLLLFLDDLGFLCLCDFLTLFVSKGLTQHDRSCSHRVRSDKKSPEVKKSVDVLIIQDDEEDEESTGDALIRRKYPRNHIAPISSDDETLQEFTVSTQDSPSFVGYEETQGIDGIHSHTFNIYAVGIKTEVNVASENMLEVNAASENMLEVTTASEYQVNAANDWDYACGNFIENGATLPKTTTVEGVVIVMPITTAEEKVRED